MNSNICGSSTSCLSLAQLCSPILGSFFAVSLVHFGSQACPCHQHNDITVQRGRDQDAFPASLLILSSCHHCIPHEGKRRAKNGRGERQKNTLGKRHLFVMGEGMPAEGMVKTSCKSLLIKVFSPALGHF